MLYFFSVLGEILMSNSGGNCIVTDRMGEGGCNEAEIGIPQQSFNEETKTRKTSKLIMNTNG